MTRKQLKQLERKIKQILVYNFGRDNSPDRDRAIEEALDDIMFELSIEDFLDHDK